MRKEEEAVRKRAEEEEVRKREEEAREVAAREAKKKQGEGLLNMLLYLHMILNT
jgi:hypothetical protein